jgi:pilus assembly protein FimV
MALGFGFNKAKVLSAAEKYVQQGKLQNAIAEYDKVSKQDPKDLTVLNTIGDLYARLGRPDQATEYFKRVGDTYAADGFVVKAIAMYKKLTKLNPSATECAVRLAELYTQQGLYNDARSQYMVIADHYLKINDREKASGVLKKMLDLDPDNAAMQTKVADLYLKLGKNQEALDIYFSSAQAHFQRGDLDAAKEALAHVVKLDPQYAPARLLRGQLAAQAGDSSATVENLSKVADIDAQPDALRSLLHAYLKTGEFERADPIAIKLLNAHNDLSGMTAYAGALLEAAHAEDGIGIYVRYADKFLANDSKAFAEALTASVSRTKDSAPALRATLTLLQKIGAEGHVIHEVQELLAHACVQAGDLDKAAALYLELSQAEPENPLHEQNHRQIVARLGKDSATRELSAEEGERALMVEELEAPPVVVQEYTGDVAEAINSALTDAELFASYSVPEKAIAPLERILPKAPNDVRLRQRLASLYARLGRFADAANCCSVLAEVHSAAGFADQAGQFREMAEKYKTQAGDVPARAPTLEKAPAPARDRKSDSVAATEAPALRPASVAESKSEHPTAEPVPAEQPVVAEFDLSAVPVEDAIADLPSSPAAPEAPESEQITEWEDMLTVETPVAAEGETTNATAGEVHELEAQETPEEILEEAHFYIAQGMSAEAQSAIARLAAIVPDHPAIAQLRASAAASAQATAPSEPEVVASKPSAKPPESSKASQRAVSARHEDVKSVLPQPATASAKSKDVFSDLVENAKEETLLEDLIPEVAAGEPASFTAPPTKIPSAIPAVAAAAMAAHAQPATADDPLAGMLSDLDEALSKIGPSAPQPAKPQPQTMAAAPRVSSAPRSATPAHKPVPVQAETAEAQSMLSDLLDEFKEEIEEPAAEADDPDTHYNLGVAFREMGLLDEAIGELQKVCRAIDNGASFSQPMQAYTWLAQCLVDKGAPQAAIRWYERALRVGGISEDSRLAVFYDMGNAFEVAGNKKDALDKFMEVYGANIDYRDVAERIRSLRT